MNEHAAANVAVVNDDSVLDFSCCVLAADNPWLLNLLRSVSLKEISLRGCVLEPDTVDAHSQFVSRLGSIGLSDSLELIDVRGLRPSESSLCSFVASLGQRGKIKVLIGVVSKQTGLKLIERASSNVSLGFGDSVNVVFVHGKRAAFAAVGELVRNGKQSEIRGIRSDIDDAADPAQRVVESSKSLKPRPMKPWEKGNMKE